VATSRAVNASILSKIDLEALQTSIASCAPPRDIGRMTSRLESLDNIKAIEWLNLFAIFLVPVLRSRLGISSHLRVEHLDMVQRVATIVKLATHYYITPAMIDELHEELVTIMLEVEWLAPDNSSYISPNMHLSLHLAEQLRDHGPASSWWSMPYERLMGMTANIPFRPGSSSVDTAKRALALLEITAKATPELEEKSVFGRFGIRLPAGPGFEHGVRRTDNGSRYHWYRFVGDQGNEAARLMKLRRWYVADNTVRGCEPYPGWLFNARQLFRPAAQARSIDLTLGPRPGGAGAVGDLLKHPSHRPLSHVRRCLLAHHLSTRVQEVYAVYTAAIATAAHNERAQLELERAYFSTASTERTDVFAALLKRPNQGGGWIIPAVNATPLAAAPRLSPFQTVLAWYQQECGAGWDRVDVFDKLFYAGEEFGSDIVSGGQNAFISANFAGHGEHTVDWFGRVCYFVRHTFAGQAHDFAVALWFDFAELKSLKAIFDKQSLDKRKKNSFEASTREYPIIQTRPLDPDIRDLVPVHRITGRWIPMSLDGAAQLSKGAWISAGGEPKYQLVCPIRSRVHG
jgi:hypothetical protein